MVLERSAIAGLWSLQGNRETTLTEVVEALFATAARAGEPLQCAGLGLLPLWPHRALLQAAQATLPAQASKFAPLLTDVAHGYSQFRLCGEQAFDFLASHASVNIAALRDAPACRRCRLGQYTVILWWQDQQDIHLLLESSYAQSFADHIDALTARWRPTTAC
jgi:hypothetical protein